MLQGLKKVVIAIVVFSVVGALIGVLMGGLTGDYLLWIGVMVAIGGAFGTAIGYGFLPES
jgi:hypothetical protein